MDKGFYTHPAFIDVFVEVLKVTYRGPKYIKAKVLWWNRGQCGEPYKIGIEQIITIKIKHLPNWNPCSPKGK
jgi:hypothetical protein